MSIEPVETITEARNGLPGHVKEFRSHGIQAKVALVGGHRKLEGALIPIDLYERLIPAIEEIRLQDLVRRRIATQDSRPLSELVDELGIDIDLGEE